MPYYTSSVRWKLLLALVLGGALFGAAFAWPSSRALLASTTKFITTPTTLTTPTFYGRLAGYNVPYNNSSISLNSVNPTDPSLTFPRIALYGAAAGDGWPLVSRGGSTPAGQLDPAVLQAYGKHSFIPLPPTPLNDGRTDIIPALRALNPNIKIYAYVMPTTTWCGSPGYPSNYYYRHTWEVAESFDSDQTYSDCTADGPGFLYLQGQTVPSVGADNGTLSNVNLAYRENIGGTWHYRVAEKMADLYYQDIITTHPGYWDGFFMDVYCAGLDNSPYDYIKAGYSDRASFDVGWKAGYDVLGARLRTLLQNDADPSNDDMPIIGNCGQGQPSLYSSMNGWMREGFPNQNGGSWYTNMFREIGGYLFDQQQFRSPALNYLSTWSSPSSGGPFFPNSPTNNRLSRFSLGSATLGDGFSVFGPSDIAPASLYYSWWYDEYAVNHDGQATMNASDEGWLGHATSDAYQVIGTNNNADLITNSGFESDLSGWTFSGASATRETTGAPEGSADIRLTVSSATTNRSSSSLAWGTGQSVTIGSRYSMTFWAKASSDRRLTFDLLVPGGGGDLAYLTIPITTAWRQYQVPLIPTLSNANAKAVFLFGDQTGDVWFDNVQLQTNIANVWRRDFDNGSVFVNPDAVPQTVTLDHPFRKIQGTLDPTTNDGSILCDVGSPETCPVIIPANDALFLLNFDDTPPADVTDLAAQ